MLYSGAISKVITPDFKSYLTGYPEPKDRYHTEVHDDLYASCFYLKNEDTELVMIALDLCYYSKRRVNLARKAIEKASGVPETNIMISCTHTHSGPAPACVPYEVWDDREDMYPDYLDFVNEQMAAGVKEAKENAFLAKIGIGKSICGKNQGIGGNRRDPNGPADPEVWTIAILDMEDNVRGVIVNYALHPTLLHAENRAMTADYPCYIYEYFKNKYKDVVVAFQMGAAGNQSSRFFRTGQDFDEAKRVGYTLGQAADNALERMDFEDNLKLFAQSSAVIPAFKNFPTFADAVINRDIAQIKLNELCAQNAPYPIRRSQECTLIGATKMVKVAKSISEKGMDGLKTLVPFEVQVFGIGDSRIVGVSCEIFVEFALQLKAKSPYEKTFLASLTNGASSGYICTKEAYEEGGYEALVTCFAPGGGELLIESALNILNENQ